MESRASARQGVDRDGNTAGGDGNGSVGSGTGEWDLPLGGGGASTSNLGRVPEERKDEVGRRGRLLRGDGGFGPPGTKPRRVCGGGRAGLVRRSGEFGAADARPKLSMHRSGGGR